jgi:hypothetical protein
VTRFIPRWDESRHPGAAGQWVPMEFDQACKTLAGQLRRNLDHWTRSYPEIRQQYEDVLLALDVATEPVYPTGFIVQLRDHNLSLTPEIYAPSG